MADPTNISPRQERQLNRFLRRFESRYGEGHFLFLCHAAFPIIVTPDLLYQLWFNFRLYHSAEDSKEVKTINEIVVSDILLSGLFEQAGHEEYEINKDLRAYLMEKLEARFGKKRLVNLARFLLKYSEHNRAEKEFERVQEIHSLAALSVLNPSEAARKIGENLGNAIREEKIGEQLRTYLLLDIFSKQDTAFEELYIFSKEIGNQLSGGEDSAITLPLLTANADHPDDHVISIPIPPNLRGKIKRESPPSLTPFEKAENLIEIAIKTGNPHLDLSGIGLEEVPAILSEAKHLETILLFGNKLKKFPLALIPLEKLRSISLRQNDIESIPELEWVGFNSSLELLDLSTNRFSSIPQWICQLGTLESLYLENNKLEFLPENIGNLVKLNALHLRNNSLTSLPESIQYLTGLGSDSNSGFQNSFTIDGNDFDFVIPEEVLASHPQEVIGYILEQQYKKDLEAKEENLGTLPPVIFHAFASEQSLESRGEIRKLAQELREIQNALYDARQTGTLEIVKRPNASFNDIIEVFQDPQYSGRIAVFHYSDHSDSSSFLQNREQFLSFSRFLVNQDSLQLVFLNGNATERHGQELYEAGVPNVIVASPLIDDESARRFAIRFYKGLGNNNSLRQAYADAISEFLAINNPKALPIEEGGENQSYPWRIFPDTLSDWRIGFPLDGPDIQLPGPIPSIKRYAYLLCNRQIQVEHFLDHYNGTQKHRPKIYTIHGNRDENHDSLIARLSYQYLGDKQSDTRPRQIKIKNWPFKGDLRVLLKVSIMEYFQGSNWGKSVIGLSAIDIMNHKTFLGQDIIILQHDIHAEYWNGTTSELLKWYVGDFWNVESKDPETPQFVIFINVLYSEDLGDGNFLTRTFSSKYYRSNIIAELNQIAKLFPYDFIVLPELQPVRKTDIVDWLMNENYFSKNMDFKEFTDRIFGPKDTLPMSKVEPYLRKFVRELQEKYVRVWPKDVED